jgi:hypothetical protein
MTLPATKALTRRAEPIGRQDGVAIISDCLYIRAISG